MVSGSAVHGEALETVDWLFEKKFIYNWTVNPEDPGLTDFLVFIVKIGCISALAMVLLIPLVPSRSLQFFDVLVSPILEEQARVHWMHNAKRALRAGMIFAVLIALFELWGSGAYSLSFETLRETSVLLAVRVIPTSAHLVYTFIGYRLIRRHTPVVRVWLVCVATHIVFNAFMADPIGGWVEAYAYKMWAQ